MIAKVSESWHKVVTNEGGTHCFMNGGLSGNYADFEFSWLESPIFDLRSLSTDPILKFSIARDIENFWDGFTVQYAAFPFGTWTTIGYVIFMIWKLVTWQTERDWFTDGSLYGLWYTGSPQYGWSNGGYWETVSHVLYGLRGQIIILRFAFGSDSDYTKKGVAIDDIAIFEGK